MVFHVGQLRGVDLHLGSAGVDLFFVISGCVMWLVTAQRETTPGPFLARRFWRVAPLYWLITLAGVAGALVWPHVYWDVHPTTAHVLKSLAFFPPYNPAGLPFPALAQGWTLNYEALFYGLFALALLLPRRVQFPAIGMTLTGLLLFGLSNAPLYMLLANSLLLEFLAGMALGRLLLTRRLPPARWGLALIILSLIAFAATWPVGEGDPGNWRSLAWGIPSVGLVAGALAIEAAGRWPAMPWLERLGDASYALYLTQRLTVAGVGALLLGAPAPVALAAAFVASLAVGFAVHRLIEQPLLRLSGRVFRPRTTP